MIETYLAQSVAFAVDVGRTLYLVGQIGWDALSRIPLNVVLSGAAAFGGLALPVVAAARMNQADATRRLRVRRARNVRRKQAQARGTFVFLGRAETQADRRQAATPAVRARELVRQGITSSEVCRQTRLSFDALALMALRSPGHNARKVRPAPASLAGSAAGPRPDARSVAAA